jgi:hypothetical protein
VIGPAPGEDASAESVFSIDPQEMIWRVARLLVDGQRTISQFSEAARTLKEAKTNDPAVLQVLSQFEEASREWFHEALPNHLAAMQVAIEAYDTFGSGFTRVEDPIDAAVWSNKLFVWRERLGGSISGNNNSSRGGTTGTGEVG